ncbi:MAG: hypothetical protein ISS81_02420 [Candidatus Marinimicrobia bacterium]|nr:hypothetical protein [Candidatus Neomarinimicrobiota bacterium]
MEKSNTGSKTIFIFFLFLPIYLIAQNVSIDQNHSPLSKVAVDDDSKFTTVGNIGVTISNFGTIGDGFVEQMPVDQPSCEYPKGSGIEHLFVGGLWVGAIIPSGIHVSTGAFNTPRLGGGGSINFEFTSSADLSDRVMERSSIPEDKFFSIDAISHQDFIADFTDTNTIVPGTSIQIPYHYPLGLGIHLETYAWNYPFADAFIIFNYSISNIWDDTLRDVYVGLWSDLVVRNTNITPPRVGSPFYLHAGVGYVDNDSMKLVYCYDYNGDPGFTDSYVAVAFLGADPVAGDPNYQGDVFHNWWLFSGGDSDEDRAPSDEGSRYQRMTESITDSYFDAAIFQKPGNRMSLITTGPFASIPPDSSINVVFAFVCAKKAGINPSTVDDKRAKQNLIENNWWAYRAYHGEDSNRNGILDYAETDSTEDINGNGKLDRYILPTPPMPPYLKAIPGNSKVTLLWDSRSEESIDLITKSSDFEGYRVYRSFIGADQSTSGITTDMGLVGEFDNKDGLFYDTGLDSIYMSEPIIEYIETESGEIDTIVFRYKLEIDNLHNGWQYAFSVTAFDSGDVKLRLGSLESSKLQNLTIVSPGTPDQPVDEKSKIGVYPNPYRANALWDGSFERERKLFFYNLPSNCEVRIYSIAGDLVDKFIHHGMDYHGQDIKWYEQFSFGNTVFPGGEHAWDLVSRYDQAIATGLYIFTVKDINTGNIFKGKFLVIK